MTTIPPDKVRLALKGRNFSTHIIHDPRYGDYLTVGVPIRSRNRVIGYLCIDLSSSLLSQTKNKVVKNSALSFVSSFMSIVVLLIVYTLVQQWYRKTVKEKLQETEMTYQSEMTNLLTTVKSIRHDFANHMQVLHGLIHLKYYEKADAYMKSFMSEWRHIELSQQLQNPALLVLLKTKLVAFQNYQIETELDIDDDPFDNLDSTDLIKIMSNLIDNAIDATNLLPADNRSISITCRNQGGNYVFKVENTGRMIPQSKLQQIFESGYTSKRSVEGKTRGFGLSIVQQTAHKYSGNIHVESNEWTTSFTVSIPVK